jgi:RNA polymerase sigma-70 factor (ECF subfamily)
MQPQATQDLLTANMDAPASESRNFDEVVHLCWRRVFRFVLISVRDAGEAENLTQDCFCRAYRGWHRFRGDSSVDTWLMHIAANVIRDFFRNRRIQFWRRAPSVNAAEIDDSMIDRSLSPEANAVIRQQVRDIWIATEILPFKQRTAFLLRFVDEMELSEIAKVMGVSEGAVKTHLFRAVHAVRKRLGRSQ